MSYNECLILLVKKLRNSGREATKRMKQSRTDEANNSAEEKRAENELLLHLNLNTRPRQKVHGNGNKRNAPD